MTKLLTLLSLLDWIVSGTFLSVGMYLDNRWMMLGGALGLLIAYFSPAKKVQAFIEKRYLSKKRENSASDVSVKDDAFYASVLGESETLTAPSQPSARAYASVPTAYTGIYIGANKHNLMSVESLNLYIPNAAQRLY